VQFNTRLEALYIWTTRKDSDTARFATDSQAIDFRVKRGSGTQNVAMTGLCRPVLETIGN
jgi:hypothetical protein